MLYICLSMLDTQEEKIKFEQLYNDCRQDMYAISYSILNNKEDAEDAVEQSFFKIAKMFKKIMSYSGRKLRLYAIITCKNTAKDMYRKNKMTSKWCEPVCDLVEIPYNDKEYEDIDFENEDFEKLKSAIRKLPEKYQDVLYLSYWKEFKTKDIAKILCITEDNVYQRISRAKKLLMVYLRGDENNV